MNRGEGSTEPIIHYGSGICMGLCVGAAIGAGLKDFVTGLLIGLALGIVLEGFNWIADEPAVENSCAEESYTEEQWQRQ